MDVLENETMFKLLVDQAMHGEHSKFEFIKNLEELHVVNIYIRGTSKIVKAFKQLRKTLLKAYIAEDSNNVETIMAIKQFKRCMDYYEKELRTAKSMRAEYKEYVLAGHFLDTILGINRADKECKGGES